MNKSLFFQTLCQLRAGKNAKKSGASAAESELFAFQAAIGAVEAEDLLGAKRLEAALGENRLARAILRARKTILNPRVQAIGVAERLELLKQARENPGPYSAWIIEALCIQFGGDEENFASGAWLENLEELFRRSLDAEHAPAISCAIVAGFLLQERKHDDKEIMARWSALLADLIDKIGLGLYGVFTVHYELVAAAARGESKRCQELMESLDKLFSVKKNRQGKNKPPEISAGADFLCFQIARSFYDKREQEWPFRLFIDNLGFDKKAA